MRAIESIGVVFPAIILALMISCTGSHPASPPVQEMQQTAGASGHVLLGSYAVQIDLHNESVQVEPLRSGSTHFNVTEFLFPPYCPDCFTIQVTEFDWTNYKVTAEVTVRNFTKLLTGYDVRGIVYPLGDYILQNPHAYTLLHAPPGVFQPSGFRAFDTADPDRAMMPGEEATETFVIGFPPDAGFIDMVYAVGASHPDHCPEPYDITDFSQGFLGVPPGSTAQVSVYVQDWQNDIGPVTINTDVLGGDEVQLTYVSGDLWSGTVENILGMPEGEYPCMITAKDDATLIQLFQRVRIVTGDPSDNDPPTWDSDIGITEAGPGMAGILVHFGSASDPSEPVTYNLYWEEGETLDFVSANLVDSIENSPYLLEGLSPGLHTLCMRAEDDAGNETTNTELTTISVGEHPNVWWVPGPDMPTARGYAGSFISDGGFWVVGGSTPVAPLDAVEKYDFLDGTWSSPWSLPDARDSFGCGALDGKAYIFGGRYSETDVTIECLVILIATGQVEEIEINLPLPLANMGCALIDGTFYLAGGRYFTGTQWDYHREAFSLTPPDVLFLGETDLEYDTAMMGFAAGEDYLMTCGGHPSRVDTLYHIPSTKSWQFMAELDGGRQGNCSVLVDGWFYSIGGEAGWMAMSNVDAYDVDGDAWYSINPVLHSRAYATAATDGTYIYVAGGLISIGPAIIPMASFEIGKIY